MALTKEELGYDIEALKRQIDRRKQNIGVFESAIIDERVAIERETRILYELEAIRDVGKK